MTTRTSFERQKGMALIEALVSMLIFSLAILGLVALQAKAVQFSGDSEDRTRAALLASELVTKMWEQQTTSTTVLAGEITAWQARVADNAVAGLPNGAGAVVVDNVGLATITVTWKAPWQHDANDNKYSTQVVIP